MKRIVLIVFAALWATLAFAQNTVQLQVDASDAPRRLFHVHMTMPAKPGSHDAALPGVDSRRTWTDRANRQPGGPQGERRYPDGRMETRQREHVRVSLGRTCGLVIGRRCIRFHLAARRRGLHLGELCYQRASCPQLEPAALVSARCGRGPFRIPDLAARAQFLEIRNRPAHSAGDRQRDSVPARTPNDVSRLAAVHGSPLGNRWKVQTSLWTSATRLV